MGKMGRWLLAGCVLTALVCLAALALQPVAVDQAPYGGGLPYGVQSTEGEGSTFWFELSRA